MPNHYYAFASDTFRRGYKRSAKDNLWRRWRLPDGRRLVLTVFRRRPSPAALAFPGSLCQIPIRSSSLPAASAARCRCRAVRGVGEGSSLRLGV